MSTPESTEQGRPQVQSAVMTCSNEGSRADHTGVNVLLSAVDRVRSSGSRAAAKSFLGWGMLQLWGLWRTWTSILLHLPDFGRHLSSCLGIAQHQQGLFRHHGISAEDSTPRTAPPCTCHTQQAWSAHAVHRQCCMAEAWSQ